jgi:hypothetical protein
MSLLKRIGAKKEKFSLVLLVHSIHINLPDDSLTKVVVKRGSKKSGESPPARISRMGAIYEYLFETVTSMYSKSNTFLKKTLEIRLYNLEGSKPNKDGKCIVSDT